MRLSEAKTTVESRIESFLSQYQSEKTKHTYKWALGEYFKSVYGNDNLEENSDKYFAEKRDYEEDLKNFLQQINGKPPLTVRLMIAAAKSFLIENDVELPQKFWRAILRKVKGTRAATMDAPPSNNQLRRIITHMPVQGTALFLTLASSGMRIGETLQLRLNDIELEKDPAKINLRREYAKTGNARITFISSEAKEAIQEWLKVRDDYLVAAVKKSKKRPHYKGKFKGKSLDDDRLFPFDIPTAYYIWKNALKKSGFLKRDNGTNRMVFHPHVLRKFFRSQMAQLTDVDVVEALMGHEDYLTGVYRKYTPTQLAEFYKKGESSVLVFGKGIDVSELKENLKGVHKAVQAVAEDMNKQNTKLEEKVKEQDKEIQSLKAQISSMYTFVHYNLDPVLDLFNEITATDEGRALLKKIQEEKQVNILKD